METRTYTLKSIPNDDTHNLLKTLLDEVRKLNGIIQHTPDKVLTEQRLLEMLGIGAKTLRSYRANGDLAYSKIGNKFFYRQSDIDKMIEKYRVECDNV